MVEIGAFLNHTLIKIGMGHLTKELICSRINQFISAVDNNHGSFFIALNFKLTVRPLEGCVQCTLYHQVHDGCSLWEERMPTNYEYQ